MVSMFNMSDKLLCFPEETPVHTPEGVKPIASLRQDDLVLSYDEENQCVVARCVKARLKNWTVLLIKLKIGDETLWATRNHPVYVENQGRYLLATQLDPGMTILGIDLKPRLVEKVELMATDDDTYNIDINGRIRISSAKSACWCTMHRFQSHCFHEIGDHATNDGVVYDYTMYDVPEDAHNYAFDNDTTMVNRVHDAWEAWTPESESMSVTSNDATTNGIDDASA